MSGTRLRAATLLGLVGLLGGCQEHRTEAQRRGVALIRDKHCGSCHTIPGVRGANGTVGPPLAGIARRGFIAGQVPNTPDNLAQWVRDPPSIAPNTAMPALGLDAAQAGDVAAYLLALR